MRQKHVSGGVSEAGPTRDLNVTLLQYAEYVKLASRGGPAGSGPTEGRDGDELANISCQLGVGAGEHAKHGEQAHHAACRR